MNTVAIGVFCVLVLAGTPCKALVDFRWNFEKFQKIILQAQQYGFTYSEVKKNITNAYNGGAAGTCKEKLEKENFYVSWDAIFKETRLSLNFKGHDIDNDTYKKVNASGKDKEAAKRAYEEGEEKIRQLVCKYVKIFFDLTVRFSVKLSASLGKCISDRY